MKSPSAVSAMTIAAIASGLLLMTPAVAAERTFKDPRGDGGGGADISRVEVNYTRKALVVRVKIRNIAQDGGVTAYVDTLSTNRGPEFALFGGIDLDGTDWRVTRVDRWGGTDDELICDSDLSFKRNSNVVAIKFAKDCLTNPDTYVLGSGEVTDNPATKVPSSLRVAVRTEGSGSTADWSPRARRFLSPVSRG